MILIIVTQVSNYYIFLLYYYTFKETQNVFLKKFKKFKYNIFLDFCIENHPTSENNVFKEENITCHLPLDQIKSNSITDQYFDTVMKEEIKIKSNSFNSKINHSCLLENDNLSSNKDNYSKLNKSKIQIIYNNVNIINLFLNF